ncbi:SAM-dependent methyltransferase [Chitinivorax tropicus]|uniref:SAM-dependent methyltransferase n=1 Tax=Chitinivorax tropicus TaxID=714531 RepID=A0A840ML27_9PROT|nr:methyltransferase domain-containing protein [Chitinivorax tropicus]MBB5017577.1 SAM-dependent methyltransferase [Chitinivorax tropicus]
MKILNPAVESALQRGESIKLNIGGGSTRREGYFNIDRVALPEVDIVADLNAPLSLLPDNSVSAIYTNHVLEHIENLLGLMEEIHRICQPDAQIEIIVPHFSSPWYYSDPTHVRPWGIYTIDYFMDKEDQMGRRVPSYYSSARFRLLERKVVFTRKNLFDRIVVPILRVVLNRWFKAMEAYERRWVWIYPVTEIQMRVVPKK